MQEFAVVAVGNAIVDVIATVDDAFLVRHDLPKGVTTLIDEANALRIYAAMGPAVEKSGGSAGNTIAGIASLGGKAAYMGRVRDDALGDIFRHDIRAIGVNFDTAPATSGPATARCFVFVTPDAQRTMMTYLGAAVEFRPEDIDEAVIAAGKITYLEGYLWDEPLAKAAVLKAAQAARQANRKVALTLSDPFCVDRHRDTFRELIDGHVDILFANEAEIISLTQTESFDAAVRAIGPACEIAAITRSELGSVVVSNGKAVAVPAAPIRKLVDTTGAGDLYAGGFLWALTEGRELPVCAQVGAIAAAEVIQHIGARPEADLAALVRAAGI